MKSNKLLLKIYGEQVDGQWTLLCLDFSLAAQAKSLSEAKELLHAQIKEYLIDALHGQDREFAATLLTRRAPLKYWLKWYFGRFMAKHFGHKEAHQRSFRAPVPMVPA